MSHSVPVKDPLRSIPSVDQLLRSEELAEFQSKVGLSRLTSITRAVTDHLRAQIQSGELEINDRQELLSHAVTQIKVRCNDDLSSGIQRVINATGVILHTNLGRAPLSEAARNAVNAASGYCTLEFDSETGSRGARGARVEELLVQLTGAESALIVNNCAAAALLILSVLAQDGETIVSRGELVEIGGDFRVPDVMANSGTRMVEVGSTNRTHLSDYQKALNSNTRLVMRVHPSNYRIVGFTDAPTLNELAAFAHDAGLPLYEDAGSGVLQDLSAFGLQDEPIISESLKAGADVVSFSGDKLLGAAQAGLIVGRKSILDRLRKHSLYRALRADKLCLAALEATLESHRRNAVAEVPALNMLSKSSEEIGTRAKRIVERLTQFDLSELTVTIIEGESAIGGGSGPNVHPPTQLIALKHNQLSPGEIQRKLRDFTIPVIARVADDLTLLDLRTVDESEEELLVEAVMALGL